MILVSSRFLKIDVEAAGPKISWRVTYIQAGFQLFCSGGIPRVHQLIFQACVGTMVDLPMIACLGLDPTLVRDL
jgi:hypothetical protein